MSMYFIFQQHDWTLGGEYVWYFLSVSTIHREKRSNAELLRFILEHIYSGQHIVHPVNAI